MEILSIMLCGALCFFLGALLTTLLIQKYGMTSLDTQFENAILQCKNDKLKQDIELLEHRLIKMSCQSRIYRDTEKSFCPKGCEKQ